MCYLSSNRRPTVRHSMSSNAVGRALYLACIGHFWSPTISLLRSKPVRQSPEKSKRKRKKRFFYSLIWFPIHNNSSTSVSLEIEKRKKKMKLPAADTRPQWKLKRLAEHWWYPLHTRSSRLHFPTIAPQLSTTEHRLSMSHPSRWLISCKRDPVQRWKSMRKNRKSIRNLRWNSMERIVRIIIGDASK